MLWTAILMGLMGSFHCVGMCGPIVLAMSGGEDFNKKFMLGKLLYNSGRVVSYSMMGLVLGLFSHLIAFSLWQQFLSIFLGVLFLGIIFLSPNWETHLLKIPLLSKGLLRLRKRLSHLLRQKQLSTHFQLGLLNGFLPCGFVYFALAAALVSGSYLESVAYMALFGLGTIPAMLLVAGLGHRFRPALLKKKQGLIRAFAALFAILLILRGLGLGIPFVSPVLG